MHLLNLIARVIVMAIYLIRLTFNQQASTDPSTLPKYSMFIFYNTSITCSGIIFVFGCVSFLIIVAINNDSRPVVSVLMISNLLEISVTNYVVHSFFCFWLCDKVGSPTINVFYRTFHITRPVMFRFIYISNTKKRRVHL
jgi:hypothetical protein